MSSFTQTSRKNLLLRGFVAGVVVISAFAMLGAYRHMVPTSYPRLLSQDHEVRRELARAERINLRTGVTCEEGAVLPDAGSQLCANAVFLETFDRLHDAAPILSTFQSHLAISVLNRSMVLNL
jgi:hypothetical protein